MDTLTKLANRRYFDQQLEQEWHHLNVEQSPLSLILCDIDCFQTYNKIYGIAAGDECLRRIADCLRSCVKRTTDVVARYGGEEFAILLPHTNAMGAFQVAEKMREKIKSLAIEFKPPDTLNLPAPVVTVSLGVSSLVDPHTDIDALIMAANQALYLSKQQGRDRVTLSSV
ncbi:MAG: diguanylate cyclase [Coleofasciculus sp. B1-GNL1-01]|uniref:diguanylate cyclase n=1 Tax=Coleofasciculus sp. B1-GNL1-01 TaxID=3068484 RepID=UPI0032F342F7